MDLFRHYLKVAFRNLRKYKSQTFISTIGLVAGFTCFALSAVWIRYEMTFDNFQKDYERIYLIEHESLTDERRIGYDLKFPVPFADYLEKEFPEVEDVCYYRQMPVTLKPEGGGDYQAANVLSTDSTFLGMFDIKILEGSADYILSESHKLAITQKYAQKLFGRESALGKKLNIRNQEWEIGAVIEGWPVHSNFSFDIILNNPIYKRLYTDWKYQSQFFQMFVKLREGIDKAAFQKKMDHLNLDQYDLHYAIRYTPLHRIRIVTPVTPVTLKFSYVLLFGLIGLLVIICALLNFITLYVSRFQIRKKELTIRMICGGSRKKIFMLMITEVCVRMLPAIILAMALIELLLPSVKKIAFIQASDFDLWKELAVHCVLFIVSALLLFALPIWNIGRKTYNQTLHQRLKTQNYWRKTSTFFQLAVSIGIMFSTVVLTKQLYFLMHTDLGLDRLNIAAAYIGDPKIVNDVADQLRKESVVTEVLSGYEQILPQSADINGNYRYPNDWDKKAQQEFFVMRTYDGGDVLCRFYNIRMVEGEMLNESHAKTDVVISESLVKAFGWDHGVGHFYFDGDGDGPPPKYTVVGVCEDLYTLSPTTPPENVLFRKVQSIGRTSGLGMITILVKYQEGKWAECKKAIERLAGDRLFQIENADEGYNRFLKSENSLLMLLEIISAVSVLIAVFGIYSLVTLSCEQRQKEIAIRKVNGATVKDILDIFFKEYMMLLGISALVALPVGTIIMKRWIEAYVLRTSLSVWIYIVILMGTALIIALSIFRVVLRAARQNPATVIRTE